MSKELKLILYHSNSNQTKVQNVILSRALILKHWTGSIAENLFRNIINLQ